MQENQNNQEEDDDLDFDASTRKKTNHELFAEEFLRNGNNAYRAYETVYNSTTKDVIASGSSRLMKHPKVVAIIQKGNERVRQEFDLTVDNIAQEYLELLNFCKEKKDKFIWHKTLDSLAKLAGFTDQRVINNQMNIITKISFALPSLELDETNKWDEADIEENTTNFLKEFSDENLEEED